MPRFALTFDDGPGPSTGPILDILAKYGVKATFFVLGRNLTEALWSGGDTARASALVTRALSDGHTVGNHTFSHAKPLEFLDLPADIARCDQALAECRKSANLNPAAIPPFRLPYGIRLIENVAPVATGTIQTVQLDPRVPILSSLGRTHVHWTCEFADWTLTWGDAPELARHMLEHVGKNAALGLDAVLLLHDGGTGSSWGFDRRATETALGVFLKESQERGWCSFTVPIS